jgi:two-component system OmpR family response regulator
VVGESPTGTCRALIVEDDATSRDALCRLLKITGHAVDCCDTAASAISYLLEHRDTDCVLLDLNLPGENGVAVLRYVRKHALSVRVAIVTAEDQPLRYPGLRDLNPEAVFRKPIDFNALRNWLAA